MKGGYQMLDLSGIDFSTESAGARITDTDFIKDLTDALNSGKPILAYGFSSGVTIPTFAKVSKVGLRTIIMSVTSAINPSGGGVGAYIIEKTDDVVKAYYKQYSLS